MSRRSVRRDETGAITIMVALSMVAILVAAAMVLDFGIARLDRQQNKSVADSAVAAGMRGLDRGDGKTHAFSGVCQALNFLRANKPELSSLTWAPCSDPAKLASACQWGAPSTYADYSGSAAGITVEIHSPYNLATSGWPEEQLPSLAADQLTPQDSCDQLAVIIRQSRQPGLGSLATDGDLTTAVRSVGRVTEGIDDSQPVALLLLERTGCSTAEVNGGNSYIRVFATGSVPGLIHSDSSGTGCTGQQRILVGDHADGIIAYSASRGPGIIRVHALGTTQDAFGYDSATNVVAEGGAVGPGPVVGRGPVDTRYISAARSALSDYETQYNSGGAPAQGWTSKNCNASASSLGAVSGPLWISCGTNAFNTSDVTLNASKVFFDAKTVSASNLAMPNATRVYIRGDTATNGKAINLTSGYFAMGQGSNGAASCPNTTTTPTLTRSRLIIGAGSFSANSSSTVRLCSTTVVLRGGVGSSPGPNGCIPLSTGTAPFDNVCNGRLSLGGATDWTAPNKITSGATTADWNDFEDLALWTEASGDHDIGGGGFMRLSGIFFLPNGAFKVHGGSGQDVKNSQYISRSFRADGGSVLELQPIPYDVVGVPAITSFVMVR